MPPGSHWATCIAPTPQSQLDVDGHPVRGGLVPCGLPPRRMWGGARTTFLAPIRVGDQLTRRSRLSGRADKCGTSGALTLLELEHLYEAEDGPRIHECQTLIYLEAVGPVVSAGSLPEPADLRNSVTLDETFLFRFSALTWNAHRIHYDRSYAVGCEGHSGVVAQGTLIAALLLELCRRDGLRVTSLDHRARGPCFAGETAHLDLRRVAGGAELSAWASGGRLLATARAEGVR